MSFKIEPEFNLKITNHFQLEFQSGDHRTDNDQFCMFTVIPVKP